MKLNTKISCNDIQTNNDIIKSLEKLQKIIHAQKPHVIENDNKAKMSFWTPTSVGKNSLVGFDNIIRRMILDACEKSEHSSPGTSELTLAFSVSLTIELMKMLSNNDYLVLVKNVQDSSAVFQKKIKGVIRAPSKKTIHNSINQLSLHPKITSLVIKALEIGGMESKYVVNKNEKKIFPTIERIDGHTFDIQPYFEFIENKNWEKENVKIVVIDGLIENVAEISKLLHVSNEEKSKIIIFARGFAEEVIATLKINMLRQTLDILPVRVSFDENSANTLKDIAVVTNSDLISSLKGDLISSIKHEELKECKKIIASNKCITIYTKDFSPMIHGHLNELKTKKATCQNDIMNQLLDKRIKSLLDTSVTIYLDDILFSHVIELDIIFSEIGSFIKSGYVDFKDIELFIPAIFVQSISDIAKIKKTDSLPAISLLTIIRCSVQVALSIASIKTTVLVDN